MAYVGGFGSGAYGLSRLGVQGVQGVQGTQGVQGVQGVQGTQGVWGGTEQKLNTGRTGGSRTGVCGVIRTVVARSVGRVPG